MTPQQIAKRIQIEADARFGETIERLLCLLMQSHDLRSNTSNYVNKWMMTGLLDKVEKHNRGEAAFALEGRAHKLVLESMSLTVKDEDAWNVYVTAQLIKSIAKYLPMGQCYCDALVTYDPVTFAKRQTVLCENCKNAMDDEWKQINVFTKSL